MRVEHSAYLRVPIDWLYSVYHYLLRRLHRPLLLAGLSGHSRRQVARDRPGQGRRMTHADQPLCPLRHRPSSCSGPLGLPIGHSMIVASIFYLLMAGLDLGTAAEQMLNGLFNSYVLLAVPLFILAADLMNVGSAHRPALAILSRSGRPFPRRPRPRQRGRQHDFCRHVGFGDRRRRRHRPHHHRHDDQRRPLSDRLCRRDHGLGRHHRADRSAVDSDGRSTRWSRTRRSAICSSAASSRA